MYLTYNDLLSRIPSPSPSPSPNPKRIRLLTEKQAICVYAGLSSRYHIGDSGLVVLPTGCKVHRGFDVLPSDHVAQADLYKYLAFRTEGQIYIIPVRDLVDDHDLGLIDPSA